MCVWWWQTFLLVFFPKCSFPQKGVVTLLWYIHTPYTLNTLTIYTDRPQRKIYTSPLHWKKKKKSHVIRINWTWPRLKAVKEVKCLHLENAFIYTYKTITTLHLYSLYFCLSDCPSSMGRLIFYSFIYLSSYWSTLMSNNFSLKKSWFEFYINLFIFCVFKLNLMYRFTALQIYYFWIDQNTWKIYYIRRGA